jgi:hypothetical protein
MAVQHREDSVKDLARQRKHAHSINMAAEIAFVKLAEQGQIDDVTITEHPTLFMEWTENYTGKRGAVVVDGGKLYRALHDVLVPEQNVGRPSEDTAGQMWRCLGDPGAEWPDWSQPILPDDGYLIGDKVTHNGKHWAVTLVGGDGRNVWEPGVYGWEEVTE